MMTKNHYFVHLNNSPWPMLTSLGVLNLAMSVVTLLKYQNLINTIMSLTMISIISMSWWMTMKSEMNKEGTSMETLENSFKTSMVLFISSEILFFFSMFWAYQHFNLVPEMEIGANWPPLMVKMFDSTSTPVLNTLVLLTSGVTVTVAHKMMILKKKNMLILMKMLTVSLGLLFSLLQYEEYNNSFFSMSDSSFGTIFFLLTGFHGIHVIVGSTFLIVNSINQWSSNTSKENLSFEMAAWYWHFVDVVWLFVFYMLYYLNN